MDISVILPTYCECGNIRPLIEAIQTNLAPTGWQIEIIVVDDASPDGTAEVVRSTLTLPGVHLQCLVREQERGLASAIKYGILYCNGERVLVMDTDFNHSPDNLRAMAETLDTYDMVIGSRFVRGGDMEDRFRYVCVKSLFEMHEKAGLKAGNSGSTASSAGKDEGLEAEFAQLQGGTVDSDLAQLKAARQQAALPPTMQKQLAPPVPER